MLIKDQMILKRNILLKKYLRENSYHYKNINRNFNYMNILNKEMKEKYKMTLPNKLDKIKENMDMITTFMDIIE